MFKRFFSIQSRLPFIMKGSTFYGRSIYLDVQATSQVDPRVLDKMMPYMMEEFGNSSSRTHMYGWETEEAVEKARKNVANLIGADSSEIVFTSGATESNNIAIKGLARFVNKNKSKNQLVKNHLITTQIEHKCVLDSYRSLEEEGYKVTYLPVEKNGILNLNKLEEAITPETFLVSVMTVNNEIGTIQPIKEIGEVCKKDGRKIFLHTDAAQAVGKINCNVEDTKVDLLSLSGHKIYGPKGIGALYVRKKPRVRLNSIISGGGQERGFRSGTLAVPLIIGLGEASKIAKEDYEFDMKHITKCSDKLYNGLKDKLTHIYLNGDSEKRYKGNLNISFSCVEGESFMTALQNIAVSSSSACTSSSLEPSYVLRALGVTEDLAHTSIRFGIGRFTTEQEIDYAVENIVESVNKLRELSPLWDMIQEGIDLNTIKWT